MAAPPPAAHPLARRAVARVRRRVARFAAPRGHDSVAAFAAGPRRCTVVVPPTRAKPIPGLTEASELKSVGLSHSAAQTRTSGPAGPLTTRLLRPTHESEAEIWAE
jgi:hypothetical protein